jgi:hypothetical protein
MHRPGHVQGGQEAKRGYLLLGVYHRRIPGFTIGKENGQLLDRKKKTAHTKEQIQAKKNRSGLLLLLLLLYTFLFNGQWHQTKRKIKEKEGVPIQAIIGRIRTLEPGSGSLWPGF